MTLEKLPFDTQRHAPPLAVTWQAPAGWSLVTSNAPCNAPCPCPCPCHVVCRCAVLAGLYSQRAEEVQLAWRAGFDALPNWCGPSAAQPAWSVTRLEQGNELQSFAGLGTFSYSRATLAFTRDPNSFMLNYFATALVMVSAWHAM